MQSNGFLSAAVLLTLAGAASPGLAGTPPPPAHAAAAQRGATPEPIRWPEFARESSPQPLAWSEATRHHPGTSLSGGSYGRSPGGGASTSYRRWPQSDRVYAPPHSGDPAEPLRWPQYQR